MKRRPYMRFVVRINTLVIVSWGPGEEVLPTLDLSSMQVPTRRTNTKGYKPINEVVQSMYRGFRDREVGVFAMVMGKGNNGSRRPELPELRKSYFNQVDGYS